MVPKEGPNRMCPSAESGEFEILVHRIMEAAAPELARLRSRLTLTAQFDRWTRPVLPLAAVLILIFGAVLVWDGASGVPETMEAPLVAEVLMPEPLGLWLEAGISLTLDELVEALEEMGR